MPRRREFDPDKAVEKAMGVFWRKGFADTSVEDLVQATRVNRYGLYDVFENKKGLYLEALDRYHRTVVSRALARLEEPDAGLAAIRATFEMLIERAHSGEARFGCLLCNAAEEVSPFDKDVARVVETYQCRLVDAFERAVKNARATGELSERIDPSEMGQYLAGLIQGASFLTRTPAAADSVEQFIRVGLRALE